MLTADLVRARVKGPAIAPIRPDPDDPEVQEIALRIWEGFRAGADDRARVGEVTADIEEAIGDLGPPKLGKGLLKIAADRVVTDGLDDGDPRELRFEVFRRAAARGGLAVAPSIGAEAAPDPFGRPTAADILAEIGAERGLPTEELAERLYADLPAERRITSFDVPDAGWLVHRYDVALVQALLAASTGVEIELVDPTPARMRQLARWIKFHQLLHTADRDEERLRIVLDGPMSLFGPSTRYGQQLARFFPALLLQPGPWRMRATVLWTKARHRKVLEVTHDVGFVSHYADTGAYRSKVHEQLVAQWAEKERGWTLSDGALPLGSGDSLVFPDFTLRDGGGREVHLEILGYWRPEALAARVEALAEHGPANLLLAVSKKLRGARAGEVPEHPRVLAYADVVSVAKVVEAADRVVGDR